MNPVTTGRVRLAAATVLLGLLAIVVLRAWLDVGRQRIELSQDAAGLASVTWAGTVVPDGRLSVTITYDLSDDQERTLDIRVPDGARYLALDDTPIAADIGLYATAMIRDTATVSYELPGRVIRYRDGALVRMAALNERGRPESGVDGDEALFPCPRCYIDDIEYGSTVVNGALFVPSARTANLHFLQLDPIQVEADNAAIRFVGIDEGADAISMLAVIDTAAVPGLPVRDGTVAAALADAEDELSASDERFHSATTDNDGHSPRAAIALTTIYAILLAWVVYRVLWTMNARRPPEAGDGDSVVASGAPPNDLEPAMAGVVVGELGPGSRSVVAATLLELARRGEVSLTGPDPRRIELAVPEGATGSTPFERAVLASLRPAGDPLAATTRDGPPLWDDDGRTASGSLRTQLARSAHAQRLFAMVLPLAPLVIGALAVAILGIIARASGSIYEWFMVVVGPILAVVASVAAGVTLTRKGLHERDQWARYADWLRTNPSMSQRLDHTDASAVEESISALGVTLPYAAALGVAPALATALSPRRDA